MLLSSIAFGYPASSENIFQTVVAAITLALALIIQHTQAREQLVTQRKLDETSRRSPAVLAAQRLTIGGSTTSAAEHAVHPILV